MVKPSSCACMVVAVLGWIVACSATSAPENQVAGSGNRPNAGGAAGSRGGGKGGTGIGGTINPNGGAAGDAGSSGVEDGCAYVEVPATLVQVDMYVMFDATLTLTCPEGGGTRWDAFKGAMQQFVGLPAAAGLGIGIQYFSLNDGSCNAADYARPDVPIAPLPGNAQPIINSLNGHQPGGLTPLAPPLQGAIDYARGWSNSHPGHTTVVLLVTDGQPNSCGAATVAEVAAVAAAGVSGTPSIRTYVIGIVVPTDSTCFLDAFDNGDPNAIHAIAQSGGTGPQALVVQTGNNAAQQFLTAIEQIRARTTLPCTYAIPPPPAGGTIDFKKVNVNFTSGQGQSTTIPSAGTLGQCQPNQPGWYYDNPQNPTAIKLCPGTCSTVSGDARGKVDVRLGCELVGIPPPA